MPFVNFLQSEWISKSQKSNDQRQNKKLETKVEQRVKGLAAAKCHEDEALDLLESDKVVTWSLPRRPEFPGKMLGHIFLPDHEIFRDFKRIGGKGSGIVYAVDDTTGELVFACRITLFKDMTKPIYQEFNRVFKFFQDDKQYYKLINCNGAHKGGAGVMRCIGWQASFQTGVAFGHYTPEEKVISFKVILNYKRSIQLLADQYTEPLENQFSTAIYADSFYRLAPGIFRESQATFMKLGVPGLGDLYKEKDGTSEYPFLYCSNLAYSCDGFVNQAHYDQDLSRYTYGINANVNKSTARMSSCWSTGGFFYVVDDGLLIDYANIDGCVEQIWQGPNHVHATVAGEIEPGFTWYGSSTQINKRLSAAVQNYRSGKTIDQSVRSVKVLVDDYLEKK
ncbi:hypothetical protein EDC01DRAFT_636306 [Geopyxis carbonaria]|nr:hypothetical protein EDC01DRAFT_636306 [Geopyxis carbonaria]